MPLLNFEAAFFCLRCMHIWSWSSNTINVVNNLIVSLVLFSAYVTGFDLNRVWTRAA